MWELCGNYFHIFHGGGTAAHLEAYRRRQEALDGMEQISIARIPEVLACIVKELELIDGWLTLKTDPVLNDTIGPQEDWIDIYELRRMIPGDPKIELVRSWLYFHGIPHYKSGRTTLFRRQDIEDWIERSQRYCLGDFWTKKRKYREKD